MDKEVSPGHDGDLGGQPWQEAGGTMPGGKEDDCVTMRTGEQEREKDTEGLRL